jgi:chorismate synthase
MLRFLTSGESHGQALVAILDGFPSGLPINIDLVNKELAKRQQGYGRGSRQKIEHDKAEILSGIRYGVTTGAPIALLIQNRDWHNWQNVMSVYKSNDNKEALAEIAKKSIKRFRPGHADLAGTLKYRHSDIRNVLERASARETAARTAVGSLCNQLLQYFNIEILNHVISIGNIKTDKSYEQISLNELSSKIDMSEMFSADESITRAMKDAVKTAWQDGDSLGGIIEILVDNLPVGLGSYTQWDEKLDGQLAQALMSIQAIKAVEIGDGITNASLPGSEVHDALYPSNDNHLPFSRKTNHAGGIEGGMTNGARLKIKAYMKPIPTIRKGLPSLTYPDFTSETAHYERSDVCAVPAASIVCKAMISFVLARAFLNKFAGDSIVDITNSYQEYTKYCQSLGKAKSKASVAKEQNATLEMELE